ncbi:mechanosensitive ion channel family protein [Plebeiibacterium marinum]|uniref:Mechanosensing system component YbdG n=1 Tax=Plebeiibacterium marinum TaxID=2992111 RepID=A0AAE3MHP5_9BACT|nr:mechanosensitive ion channel family protein [Plebeiobacterium marinum]MCW3807660.1 mechanosensitive ion channel family protein [Plebeiobacterium marinum]
MVQEQIKESVLKVVSPDSLVGSFESLLEEVGVSEKISTYLSVVIFSILVLIIAKVAHFIVRRYLVKHVERFMEKTKSKYDDYFVKRKLIIRASYIVPALIIYTSLDLVFVQFDHVNAVLHNLVSLYFIVVALLLIDSFLKGVGDVYETLPNSNERPIKGYLQGIYLVFVLIGVLVTVSILLDVKLTVVFTGLGAIAAVLILVFKDTILGFVASIQLTANSMVKPGDWIEMPSHKSDGTVMEMTLNTVKVQNWDKTISTIPTYALVSESFKNWKGMEESGGRRIKRSINIDMKSVKFCDDKMLGKFRKIKVLKDYIEDKLEELEEYNKQFDIDESILVNGRRMTNLGVFRKYLEGYLHNHPKIHQNMTFLVRHLQPTEKGIPIEIYVFSNDQAWANYESIQADIFDHILAVLPEFELTVFQFPTEKLSATMMEEV